MAYAGRILKEHSNGRPHTMEFKQLQSFVTVAKWESFTKAAELLYLSQPTISAHIRQLEEELHTRLISRTTKTVELTPKGRELYEYAVNILELRKRMVDICSDERQNVIYLGASTIPSSYILPEVLPIYREQYPDTYFVTHQSDSQEVINGLLTGIFDIGMTGMCTGESCLIWEPFYQDRMTVITPVNEHFLALQNESTTSIRELLKEPMIFREKGSGSKKSADILLESMGVFQADLRITAYVNDQEAIKNLVAGGLGISIISEKAARNFGEEKRILIFEFPELNSSRDLYLVYRRDDFLSGRILDFVKFVKGYFQSDCV